MMSTGDIEGASFKSRYLMKDMPNWIETLQIAGKAEKGRHVLMMSCDK